MAPVFILNYRFIGYTCSLMKSHTTVLQYILSLLTTFMNPSMVIVEVEVSVAILLHWIVADCTGGPGKKVKTLVKVSKCTMTPGL